MERIGLRSGRKEKHEATSKRNMNLTKGKINIKTKNFLIPFGKHDMLQLQCVAVIFNITMPREIQDQNVKNELG